MTNIYNLTSLKNFSQEKKTIVIGNFDSIHLGHKFFIKQAEEIALNTKTLLAAITFIPHSNMILNQQIICNLFKEEAKYKKLFEAGIKKIFIVKNDPKFFNLTAEDFIEKILISKLNCTNLVVGKDFRFGNKRLGNVDLLLKYQSKELINIKIIDNSISYNDLIISSSNIRKLLSESKIGMANKLLGYNYFIEGEVIKGKKISTDLGFPTLNLDISNIFVPRYGVYSGLMEYNNKIYKGVLNIGITPCFEEKRPKLEMHIFNFNKNLYGKNIKIIPLNFERKEIFYNNIADLKNQMQKDCEIAKTYLLNYHQTPLNAF